MQKGKPSKLSRLLQKGVEHHQAGRLKEARAVYRSILNKKPRHADALNLMGVLSHQTGNNTAAVDLIEKAIKINPDNPDYHNNCGTAYWAGKNNDSAISHYSRAIQLKPGFIDARLNLALTYRETGQYADAVKHYEQILEIRPDNVKAMIELGNSLQGLDRIGEAAEWYEKALSIQPDDLVAMINLGTAREKTGRTEDAISLYQKVLSANPDFAEAHNNLANVLHTEGRLEEAIKHYERALEITPGLVNVYSNLADLYEKTNRVDKAVKYLQKVLQLQPDEPRANRITAALLRREGKLQDALDILRGLPLEKIEPETACMIHFDMGKIYDSLQDYESAFSHFREGNRIHQNTYEASRYDKNLYLDIVKNINQQFSREWVQSWTRAAIDNTPEPVAFLVGFPRSGTTLLDQILDSHPGIRVIEEKPLISELVKIIGTAPGGYPAALANLTSNDIRTLRENYRRMTERYIDRQKDLLIIDKLPLNLVHTGLINRVFPESRIILALRHPCDVCLSNFMQGYSLNNAMANFFTLEDSAVFYDMVMQLWQRYTQILPLDFMQVKYESLVSDFESETRKLLKFLDVDWDPAVLDFSSHAKSRERINTPSYYQVTRSIYTDSRYRWQRYSNHLASVMKQLENHISHFGY